jgi:diacylglycerol kinase family enzyme
LTRIAAIANPRSRKNRRDPSRLEALREQLGGTGEVYAPESLAQLAEVAAIHAADPPDVLAVSGGDGTLHRVFTELVPATGGVLPKTLVLRGGTMNIVADSVGMRLRADRALALAQAGGWRTTRRWLLKIDGRKYGFLFGNGIVARFLELYYQKPEPAPADAGWLLARGVASLLVGGPLIRQLTRRFEGTVEVDGVAMPEDSWVAVAAGTVEQLGLGFQPFYRVPENPGRMHVVGVGGPVSDLAIGLPRVRMGKPLRGRHHHAAVGSTLLLRGHEPLGYMMDGDFHAGGTEISVEMGPPVDFVVA